MKRAFSGIVAVSALAACGPSSRVNDPSRVAARFEAADRVVFGFELAPECKLETASGEGPAPKSGWVSVQARSLANRTFTVRDRKTVLSSEGRHETVSQALLLEDAKGRLKWVRSAPAPSADRALRNFSCAFDESTVKKAMPKSPPPVVRLAAGSSDCTSIAPIFGDVSSVTFAPYTVTARSLFAVKGKPVVGLRLEADGGEKAITVSASSLDKCFVAADRTPPAPREAEMLREWLDRGTADVAPPPPVSSDAAVQLTALDLDKCLAEGTGTLKHYECRTPILRIVPTKEPGPYGPPVIRLVRERLVDAMHLYAGHLVPSGDIVTANVAVRLGKVGSQSFSRSFADEIDKSLVAADMRLKRAANGFRLLRPQDISAGVPATHYVDIDVSYVVPDVSSVTEKRVHKYVAGKKSIANPKHAEAESAVETARAEVASAKQAAAVVEAGTNAVAEQAADGCKKAGSELGSGFGFLAGALCKSGTKAVGAAAEAEILKRAQQKLKEAELLLAKTPKTLSIDDVQEHTYEAKVYRRSGDATAKIAIVNAGQTSNVTTTPPISFHFEASDDEHAASPEHKLPEKAAKVPSTSDVEQKLAENLLRRIDEAIIRWGAQRQIGGDIGELRPGTRSWMVAVARQAASDRNVKLLSDLFEKRTELLEKTTVTYPVKMPKKLEGRCFTFAAIPMDPTADVNLSFGRFAKGEFTAVAIDKRPSAEAAFEVCNVSPGPYAVRVTHGKNVSKNGVLVSMFESTPGGPTAEDTLAASRGIPTTSRKGETLALNGEGVVEFRGTNNKLVVGKTGDRDGDGIADDEDRCPYDPETPNGYLDEDGCPDVAPPGFQAPTSVAEKAEATQKGGEK